ncbi:MAG: nitronate monooxygenase [Gammaproteobacteria bacterium]|nr:nitronate monooxygenase [Gammaproteobacteria bacterium]MYE52194.1 nitronate monooxygenase [Gammaproteobacteria bacterium]MYE87186.1 nitronate monooxygenase [Gammaproteobacteria bacterium]MYF50818.1 nitronate monooxygenase [Gammaproteobacteria bacterium]MYH14765.1 nitronate monooxygenase [Gammaproteobacteria bacterium]
MQSELCERLGLDHALFAFSHCRDVVAAVSNNGGMGVLGAGWMSADTLATELDWLDQAVGDNGYGVDVVIPQRYEGMEETDPETLERRLWSQVPATHLGFANRLLREHGVPEWPQGEGITQPDLPGATYATALPLVQEALRHPQCRILVNALGTPPREVVEAVQSTGRLVGALCGRVTQAVAHAEAGLDFVVAQGGEGGGHAGEIASIVLWPQVVDAIAPLPVLAAGGIGNGRQMLAAMATGAAGVWTGSLWVTVAEAAAEPAQKAAYLRASSEDTVRSRSWTGKTARVLRNAWTEAWDQAESPDPLPMPLQFLVAADARRRTERYAGVGNAQAVAMNPAGQVIGQINEIESCRDVVFRLLSEYADALEQVTRGAPG